MIQWRSIFQGQANSGRFRAVNWLFLFVLLAIFSAFGFGIGSYVTKRNLFPIPQMGENFRMLRHKLFPDSSSAGLSTHMPSDQIKELLSFQTAADVASGREKLRRQFVGAKCLYDSKLTNIRKIDTIDDRSVSSRSGESITIKLPLGFETRASLFRSEIHSKILLIYNTGHGGKTRNDSAIMSKILEAGIDVISVDLPLIGQNNQPIVNIPKVGTMQIKQHNQLALLETLDFNPMTLFVEPIACLVNHFYLIGSYKQIVQIGISGGGFIATLNAAIDPRISSTYSISGQLPTFLRSLNPSRDWGDYEQVNPKLLKQFTDLDIYLMAAHGAERKYLQIFNEFDPACYSGRGYESYSAITDERVQGIGPGKFEVWVDSSNFSHTVSLETLTRILKSLTAVESSLRSL